MLIRSNNNPALALIIIKYVFLFVAIGLITGAVIAGITLNNKYDKCSEQVTGIVTDVVKEHSSHSNSNGHSNSTYYYPVFDYCVNGEIYSQKSNIGNGNGSKYQAGQSIEIAYDPNEPNTYYIVEDKAFFVVYILGGIGAVFLIISVTFFILGRKNKQ